MKGKRSAAFWLAAALILLRLLRPEAAAVVRSVLLTDRGEAAVEAFCRAGVDPTGVAPVFGGFWDD